jgi:hypothetical protein
MIIVAQCISQTIQTAGLSYTGIAIVVELSTLITIKAVAVDTILVGVGVVALSIEF